MLMVTAAISAPALGLLRQNAMGRQIHADLKWLENRSGRPVNAVAHCFCAF